MSCLENIATLYECAVNASDFQEILDKFFDLTGLTAAAAASPNDLVAVTPDMQSAHRSDCSWNDVVNAGSCCLVRDISHNNTVVMNMAVVCQSEPTDDIYHYVSALANCIYSAWFRLRYTEFSLAESKSRRLLSLLNGSIPAATDAMDIPAPFVIAVLCSDHTEQTSVLHDALSYLLRDHCLSAYDNSEYIYLLNAAGPGPHILEDFAKRNNLTFGVSQSFDDLKELPASRTQASHAAAVASRFINFSGCAMFDEMKLYLMFDILSKTGESQHMINSQVEILVKSDEGKNTDFMRTLFCWLLNSQRAAAAAKQLGVHRNTLDNRLAKINELIDADWNSSTYSTCMLYSLYITMGNLGQLEFFH